MKRISAIVMALICSMTLLFTGPARAAESVKAAESAMAPDSAIATIIAATIASATSVGTTLGQELSDITGKHIGVGVVNATPMDLDLHDALKIHGHFDESPQNLLSSPLDVLANDLLEGHIPIANPPRAESDLYTVFPEGNSGMASVVVYDLTYETFLEKANPELAKKLNKFKGNQLAIYSRKRPPAGTQYWSGIAIGRNLPSADQLYKEFEARRKNSKRGEFKLDGASACASDYALCLIESDDIVVKTTPAQNVVLDIRVSGENWPDDEIAKLYHKRGSSQQL